METHSHTDEELLEELKKRFDVNKMAMNDLKAMTHKLEVVNKKLKESEEVKSNFLSNIKNEINNPISSILGLANQIITDSLDKDVIVSSVATIYSEAKNLDYQLRNIFIAAELEAGDCQLSVAETKVCQLIDNLVDSFRPNIEEKKLTLNFDRCGDEKFLFATDPEKFQIVLSNIISNAIEFSKQEGIIEIKIWKDENQTLKISVRDNGIGIDKEDHDRIFDRFTQIDTGVSKSHKGHGLGLSITKEIITLFNGTIQVDSAKGQGSTFILSVPELNTISGEKVYADTGTEFFFDDEESGEMEEF